MIEKEEETRIINADPGAILEELRRAHGEEDHQDEEEKEETTEEALFLLLHRMTLGMKITASVMEVLLEGVTEEVTAEVTETRTSGNYLDQERKRSEMD